MPPWFEPLDELPRHVAAENVVEIRHALAGLFHFDGCRHAIEAHAYAIIGKAERI
jgi:hypothetical protein